MNYFEREKNIFLVYNKNSFTSSLKYYHIIYIYYLLKYCSTFQQWSHLGWEDGGEVGEEGSSKKVGLEEGVEAK